jgi:hypothetical protein
VDAGRRVTADAPPDAVTAVPIRSPERDRRAKFGRKP